MKTIEICSRDEWVAFVDTLCYILKKYKVSDDDIDMLSPIIEKIASGIDLLSYLVEKM